MRPESATFPRESGTGAPIIFCHVGPPMCGSLDGVSADASTVLIPLGSLDLAPSVGRYHGVSGTSAW